MHEPTGRQLFSAYCGAFAMFACAIISAGDADSGDPKPKPAALQQELQAARLAETNLLGIVGNDAKNTASQEQLAKVEQFYERLAARYPNNATVLNAWAEYLWRTEQKQEAARKWFTAEQMEPDNPAVVSNLGAYYLECGDVKRATEYCERAANLDPKNALYQFNAGNTSYLFRHDVANNTANADTVLLRSLEYFRNAARIEPFNIDYARGYAETFYVITPPDWAGALLAWTHYLEITDQREFAYINLARVHIKLGRKQDAREDLGNVRGDKFGGIKEHLLRVLGDK